MTRALQLILVFMMLGGGGTYQTKNIDKNVAASAAQYVSSRLESGERIVSIYQGPGPRDSMWERNNPGSVVYAETVRPDGSGRVLVLVWGKYPWHIYRTKYISVPVTATEPGAPDAFGLSPDDYAIYETLFRLSRLRPGFIVVGQKKPPTYAQKRIRHGKWPHGGSDASAAFMAIDTVRADWNGFEHLGFEVMDPDSYEVAVRRADKRKEEWDRQNIFLFPIAYDAERQAALTYVSWWCGPLCGEGDLVALVRRNQRWETVWVWTLFIS